MLPECRLAVELFTVIATELQKPLGDSFEEWFFWQVPATESYRSARQGVARVQVPVASPRFDLVLWQSLLEYPDFVLEHKGACLGIECKSLRASRRFVETRQGTPCRTTIDFNSTVPCGQESYKGKFKRYASLKGQPITSFYALGLYGKVEDEDRILSFLLVDGNYINRDFTLHQTHRNTSRGGFGSYGDGRIRERKMYIFPNPLTDQDLVGGTALVMEQADLATAFPQLMQTSTKVRRTPAGEEYPFFVYRLRE
ncbi:MAG: hypothetical protein PVF45_14260 [Anaerolineae bacterium]|jgi:hypothetical protein